VYSFELVCESPLNRVHEFVLLLLQIQETKQVK